MGGLGSMPRWGPKRRRPAAAATRRGVPQNMDNGNDGALISDRSDAVKSPGADIEGRRWPDL